MTEGFEPEALKALPKDRKVVEATSFVSLGTPK
jgi:hypothetical protein